MINKNKVGLALGLFLAIVHLVWSLAVAVIPTQLKTFCDWIFKLHAIGLAWTLTPLNFVNMILLVIMTFIIGYIFGWVFVLCHNLLHKK